MVKNAWNVCPIVLFAMHYTPTTVFISLRAAKVPRFIMLNGKRT
jgi:hypothetical protein